MIDVDKNLQPANNYRLLILANTTDGATDFFNGVNYDSLIGRSILIRNIEFIPRVESNHNQSPEIQFLDETGGGNNMDLVSPNSVNPGARIVTANVEFDGIKLDFRYNGAPIQIVEGVTNYLNFDKEFKDINLYFPERLQNFYLTAEELIYTDVTAGTTGRYILQINMDIIVSPTPRQLYNYGIL